LDEFFEWFRREPRPGFTKATVSAWRVALETSGLGSMSINVRITAVRKLYLSFTTMRSRSLFQLLPYGGLESMKSNWSGRHH